MTRMTRDYYIPRNAVKFADKASDAVAYVYERKTSNGAVYPCSMVFLGKADKPFSNFRHSSPAERERYIKRVFADRRAHNERKAAARAERTAFAHDCKVGDIFRTSWGYDQTNVEFFEVIEVRGKYAILREIAIASEDNGKGSERCVPQSGAYLTPRFAGDGQGLPIRRLIQPHGIKIDDVRTGFPWGKRVAGVLVGASCYRTAAGWGH